MVTDLPGGTQPVIATCVGLPDEIDVYAMAQAVEAGAAYLKANFEEPYPANPFSPEYAEMAGEVAPVMLEELIEPKALGIAFYCVDDGEGSCVEPVESTTTTIADDTTTTTIGGNGGGTTAPNGEGGDGTTQPVPGATPTPGQASYTG